MSGCEKPPAPDLTRQTSASEAVVAAGAQIQVGEYRCQPCPFYGSTRLSITNWWDEDGEYDAIDCCSCKAAAPADVWNRRVA